MFKIDLYFHPSPVNWCFSMIEETLFPIILRHFSFLISGPIKLPGGLPVMERVYRGPRVQEEGGGPDRQ